MEGQVTKDKCKARVSYRPRLSSTAVVAALVMMIIIGMPKATPPFAHASASPQSTIPPPPPHLGYGINVRRMDNIETIFAPLGLEWIKLWNEYDIELPVDLPYRVLFAIDCREWIAADGDDWDAHIEEIAQAGRGNVEAYELCNEPNTDRFWNGDPPDPAHYTQMLQIAYERIKAVDREAIVVSAGLAPVGRIQGTCNGWEGNNCSAMDEREYARQMLQLGAGDYFDAFGYHPYGFAYKPEIDPRTVSNGFAFRGTEVMHEILEEHDLSHKQIWATEFNWVRDWREEGGMPEWCLGDYERQFGWMEVSEVQQANYITRAFQYADDNWPWMGAMFVWNLDWHNYHTWDCEAARYFSVRKGNETAQGEPALAYTALISMTKRPASFGPRLAIEPPELTLTSAVDRPTTLTTTLRPWNVGYRVLTWTAAIASWPTLTGTGTLIPVKPSLVITSGLQGEPLTVTVDTTGYPTGTFTGSITVSATTSDVLESPQKVTVTLQIMPDMYHLYLPLTLRATSP